MRGRVEKKQGNEMRCGVKEWTQEVKEGVNTTRVKKNIKFHTVERTKMI